MLRQVFSMALGTFFSAQASHLLAFSRKNVSWIDVFSCVYCNFPPKLKLSLEPRAFSTVRFWGGGSLGGLQAPFWSSFWVPLGVPWGALGAPWELLGDPWGHFWSPLAHRGLPWVPSGSGLGIGGF